MCMSRALRFVQSSASVLSTPSPCPNWFQAFRPLFRVGISELELCCFAGDGLDEQD
jgi:hypothetical protein